MVEILKIVKRNILRLLLKYMFLVYACKNLNYPSTSAPPPTNSQSTLSQQEPLWPTVTSLIHLQSPIPRADFDHLTLESMIVPAYLLLLERPFRAEALESDFLIHPLRPSTAWLWARLWSLCASVFSSVQWEQYTHLVGFLQGLNQVIPMKRSELKLIHSSWWILAICLFAGNMNEGRQFWKQTDLDSDPGPATNWLWDLGQITALTSVKWGGVFLRS